MDQLTFPQVSNNPVTQAHYQTIRGLSASLERAFRSNQIMQIEKASAAYKRAYAALVQEYGSAAVALNVNYYEDMRAAAGLGRARVTVPPPISREAVDQALAEVLAPGVGTTQFRAEGTAQKLVADTGKNALISAIMADDKVQRWARVASPAGCAFCRMIATRGAVYKSDATAGFEAHNKCNCTVEPVYNPKSYEPTASTRADQALYAESTRGVRGTDQPNALLNAFRRGVSAQP